MNEPRSEAPDEPTDATLPRLAYRVHEAASVLGVPLSSMRDLIRRRMIGHVRLPARPGAKRAIVLIPREDLDRMMRNNRVAPRDEEKKS